MRREEKSMSQAKERVAQQIQGAEFPGQREKPVKLAKPPAPTYPVISQEIISEWREGEKLSQPPSPEMYNHVPPLGGGCKD